MRFSQIFAIALALNVAFAAKPPSKIAPDVNTNTQAVANVIVHFATPPGQPQHAAVAALGGALNRELGLLNGASYAIPANLVPLIAALPQVSLITSDHPLQSLGGTVTYNGAPCDYGWMTVGADRAGSTFGVTGADIGVAVIDSGIDANPDLQDAKGKNRIVYEQSFVAGDAKPADKYGHGTAVAGIIGGTGKNSTGTWIRLHDSRHCAGREFYQLARAG